MDDFYQFSKKIDSSKFFRALGVYFLNATTIFIEGRGFPKDVMSIYKKNIENGG